MKKLLVLIPLLAAFSFSGVSYAGDNVRLDDVSMKQMKHKKDMKKREAQAIKKIVAKYMLDNGDITVEELEGKKADRKAIREELKALRESGDKEALKARVQQVRQAQKAENDKVRDYIDAHPDLADAIKAHREKMRAKRQAHREERMSEKES